MRALYTTALYLALPYVVLHLVLRGLRNRAYWRRWGERFGWLPSKVSGPYTVWVHAVSVGEVMAAVPMVRRLRQRDPASRVLVTTTTPTGSERAQAALGDVADQVYAPYDLPASVRRFLDRVRPRAAVIMETELWPNTFSLCRRRGVPVIVANARLSARSAQGYARVGAAMGRTLRDITAIVAQHREDADRFITLGAMPPQVHVTGSIKFDIRIAASALERGQVLRRCLGVHRGVWIAASTHEGEDEHVLEALGRVRERLPNSVLVLVPRHPERFSAVAALARRRGFRTVLRSESPESCDDADVFIGDTMGELPLFYAASDVAFVGGSLVPVGGHNMLEPAALELPIILGPHLFNFKEISRLMLERGAARQVTDTEGLVTTVVELLGDAYLRHRIGEQARAVVDENRGALDRLMAVLAQYVPLERTDQ